MIGQLNYPESNYIRRNSMPRNETTNPALNREKMEEVVQAIEAGKYSWACVLFLQSVGKNPMEYIPYRTFHRLQKENH